LIDSSLAHNHCKSDFHQEVLNIVFNHASTHAFQTCFNHSTVFTGFEIADTVSPNNDTAPQGIFTRNFQTLVQIPSHSLGCILNFSHAQEIAHQIFSHIQDTVERVFITAFCSGAGVGVSSIGKFSGFSGHKVGLFLSCFLQ